MACLPEKKHGRTDNNTPIKAISSSLQCAEVHFAVGTLVGMVKLLQIPNAFWIYLALLLLHYVQAGSFCSQLISACFSTSEQFQRFRCMALLLCVFILSALNVLVCFLALTADEEMMMCALLCFSAVNIWICTFDKLMIAAALSDYKFDFLPVSEVPLSISVHFTSGMKDPKTGQKLTTHVMPICSMQLGPDKLADTTDGKSNVSTAKFQKHLVASSEEEIEEVHQELLISNIGSDVNEMPVHRNDDKIPTPLVAEFNEVIQPPTQDQAQSESNVPPSQSSNNLASFIAVTNKEAKKPETEVGDDQSRHYKSEAATIFQLEDNESDTEFELVSTPSTIKSLHSSEDHAQSESNVRSSQSSNNLASITAVTNMEAKKPETEVGDDQSRHYKSEAATIFQLENNESDTEFELVSTPSTIKSLHSSEDHAQSESNVRSSQSSNNLASITAVTNMEAKKPEVEVGDDQSRNYKSEAATIFQLEDYESDTEYELVSTPSTTKSFIHSSDDEAAEAQVDGFYWVESE